jgi:YVTN family beta-propeller protein
VEFGVLGPIEAHDGGAVVPLGGPKQRALLAVLLLARNEAVSRDRLIDALWGEQPPATAPQTLNAYVSRLRKLLGADRLTRGAGGYLLQVAPGELDLDRFDDLAADGRALLVADRPADAAAMLRSALALWRGPALADVVYEPFGARAADTLEEGRLAAIEDRIEADLAGGEAAGLIGELEHRVREHPFRERLLEQLMLALYRSGQQARALDAYRAGRQRLAEELGLAPGLRLQELERGILAHDPGLAQPLGRSSRPHARPSLRALAVVAAVVAAVAAVAVVPLLILTGSAQTRVHGSTSGVAELANGSLPIHEVSLSTAPAGVASGYGSLWVAEPGEGSIVRIDLRSRSVADRIPVGGAPAAVAVGAGSVWAADAAGGRVTRIDPATGTVTQRVGLGGGSVSALAFGGGALWVGDATDDSLLEIDPATGTVRRTVTLPVEPGAVAVTPDAVWVADYDDGTVSEIDPRGGSVLATTRVGTGPSALAVTGGAIWVANELDSTVSRIDARTGLVSATIPVPSGPAALVAAGSSVWVADRYAGSVSRIDSSRDTVVRTAAVGGNPTAVAEDGGHLWIGTQSDIARRGGTVIVLHTPPITIDPALQGDLLPLVSDGLTRDELVTYDHSAGSAGTRLVPDLALNVPIATDSGTTYTFRLRPGIRYSDGRLVRAADYRRAIERIFRLHSFWREGLTAIVGASACTIARCDLSRGIVTDEATRTVTFYLRAANPGFLTNLTSAAASPVPPGTPWHPVTTPIPGTGPYVIAQANTKHIVWIRNPRFREWSHAAQPAGKPDRIVLRFGFSPAREVRLVASGRADVVVDDIPRQLLPFVETRYPAQIHPYAIPTTDFVHINTTVAPFDDLRVRRALNFAIDRRAIVRLFGGAQLAMPTCQVFPPGVVGYRRYCPYTVNPDRTGAYHGPDLARARTLVAASGTRGERVTVWGWTDDPTINEDVVRYVGDVLRELGYRVRVRLVTHASLAHPPPSVFRSIQAIVAAWGDTPYGYVSTWFACGGPYVHGWFCDPQVDRMNARASSREATNPHGAAALWAQIDRRLVNEAAWAPMVNETGIAFLSARVTNYESHPYWGLIADQLSVK